MKKLIYLFAGLSLLFTGCQPMTDINTAIDAQEQVIVGDAQYTLTSADYTALHLSHGSFSSLNDAKTMLPGFFTSKYPVWGKGSAVLAGFKLYVGTAPGVSDFTGATTYTLANSDYPSASDNAIGFYPTESPANSIPGILASKISNPTEGEQLLVKYKKYVTEPVIGFSNYFETSFMDGTLGAFETISVVGNQVWAGTNFGAKMAGYSGGAQDNEDWLISPEINLTSQTNLKFQVKQTAKFVNGHWEYLKIMISKDYAGNPATANWDVINFTTLPTGNDYIMVTTEEYDLAAYEGSKIHVAFKYESQSATSTAATWELDNLVIKTPGVEGETTSIETYYKYSNGVWALSTGVYPLTVADYDSMGTASGQPGKYNNFDSTMPPDGYIATFLGIKYPYAKEGDNLIVIYKYYSGGTQTRGNLFTFSNGAWSGALTTIDTTLQFGHDGTTWVPDNTIKYELLPADYTFIVNAFTGVSGFESAVANLNTYHNISTFNWTATQIDAAISTLLLHNNPGMAEGQKFSVTIYVYDGSSHNITINYILSNGVYVRNN